MVLGKYQTQISELPTLPEVRYENIFRMYTTGQNQYYYNLLKGLYIDGKIDTAKIFYMPVKEFLPWSIISYNAYGNIELWWLIALINNVDNPIKTPTIGTVLKVVRSEYLPQILAEIKNILE
jgi:hypothetical protein